MSKKLTLLLAKERYTIADLTVGQVEDIQEALNEMPVGTPQPKDLNRRVIQIALCEDFPDVKLDRKSRGVTVKQLQDGARAVFVFGGWIDADKEHPPGEEGGQ